MVQPDVRYVLWWIMLGMLVVIALLLRTGTRIFNREETAGPRHRSTQFALGLPRLLGSMDGRGCRASDRWRGIAIASGLRLRRCGVRCWCL